MDNLYILTSLLFFCWAIRDIFSWVSLWQRSNYLLKRLFYYKVKEFQQDKFAFILFIFKWLLFFAYFFVIFNDNIYPVYKYAVLSFYTLMFLITLLGGYYKIFRNNYLAIHSVLIFYLSIALVILIYYFPLMDRYFWLLLLDVLLPVIVLLIIFLFSFPLEIYTDLITERAVKKRQRLADLQVICLIGDSGLLPVAKNLSRFLSLKYKVVHMNLKQPSLLDITHAINNKIKNDTDIFITEISGYDKEEIKTICNILQPKIGIITAIDKTDLLLFKTIERKRVIYKQMVSSIPQNGFCLFDGDNKFTALLSGKTKKNNILYYSSPISNPVLKKGIISVTKLKDTKSRKYFSVYLNGKRARFHIRANMQLEYLLPAIYIAYNLGVTLNDIQEMIENT